GERVPGTPRAKDAAELARLGWDAETAKKLAASPEPVPEEFARYATQPRRTADVDLPAETSALPSYGNFAQDTAIAALKGAIGVPEAAVGLMDIVTGGHAGKLLEDYAGFKPDEAKAILDSYYSDERYKSQQAFQQAKGAVAKVAAALKNP